MESTQILADREISLKMRRICLEINQNCYNESEIVFMGIENKGYIFAGRLFKEYEKITSQKVLLHSISVDKENPSNNVKLSLPIEQLQEKTIILIDDVLNSGKTLMYAAAKLLEVSLKKLVTVVLVNREHKRFPIDANIVGISLSTTLQEHIRVEFTEGHDAVYLE